jgi:hypothetical protein
VTLGPSFDHLVAMTDRYGTFEHAEHAVPRREHGYCVDDVARVLVVASREPHATPVVQELARRSLRFLADAQGVTGRTRNRRDAGGRWHGRRGVEDCWGRSVWALGTAATQGSGHLAESARSYFGHAAQQRSRWPRSMAFAALGAAAVADADPRDQRSRSLLSDAVAVLDQADDRRTASVEEPRWPWPEARLTYANAVLPDALLAAGHALDRPALVDRGLALLGWLLERETIGGHLSVTPVGGAGPDDVSPRFDQQAIEVATMADACARAVELTGDARWIEGVRMAAAWFDGDNDAGVVMWDPTTGGGFDGLHADGANRNQGAESTLALVSTRQQAWRCAGVLS